MKEKDEKQRQKGRKNDASYNESVIAKRFSCALQLDFLH